MKQCVAPQGLVSSKEGVHVPGATKPLHVQIEMVSSSLPVQGVSGTLNALLGGHFNGLLCSLQPNTKLL